MSEQTTIFIIACYSGLGMAAFVGFAYQQFGNIGGIIALVLTIAFILHLRKESK